MNDRSRSPRRAAAALALAAAAAVAMPASALAVAPRCEAKLGDTLVRTTKVRVFQRVSGTIDDGQRVIFYSCRPGSRAYRRVTDWRNSLDGELRIRSVALGGSRYLVMDLDEVTGVTDSWDVFIYDLETSRRTFAFSRDGTPQSGDAVVATRSGAIALIDEEAGSVRGYDAAGGRLLEASGASNLAAAGNAVYWTAGGAPRSATLGASPTSTSFVSP